MPAKLSVARRRRRSPLPWVALALIVVVVGCSSPPKQEETGSTAKAAPAAKAEPAPAPAAKPQPAPTAKPQPAPAEKPAPRAEPSKPTGPAKSSTADRSAPGAVDVPQGTKLESEADRDRLAQMIRDAALAGQKSRQEQEPVKAQPISTAPPSEPAKPKPATGPDPATEAAKPEAHAEGEKKDAGCGSTGGTAVDLTPPPEDQPQPKVALKEPKITIEPVWRGTPAVFNFTVANEGAGPLAVKVKKG